MKDATWTPTVDSARRSASFDNRLFVGDGERFLTDPLAEQYICVPPDGGLLVPGMLPPQEMEVRAALIEAIEAFRQQERIGFWKRLWHFRVASAADELVISKVKALSETRLRSPEHRAAAARIYRSYRGEAHALLEWAHRLAERTDQ